MLVSFGPLQDLFMEMLQPPPGQFAHRGFGPGMAPQARPPLGAPGYQQPPRGFPQQFPQQPGSAFPQHLGGFPQPGNGSHQAGGGSRPHAGAPQNPGAFQQQPGPYQPLHQQQAGTAFGQPHPQQSMPPFQPQYRPPGQQEQAFQQQLARPQMPGQGGFGSFQEQAQQPYGLPNGIGPVPGAAFGGGDPFGPGLADSGPPAAADPFSGLVPGMRAALPQVGCSSMLTCTSDFASAV